MYCRCTTVSWTEGRLSASYFARWARTGFRADPWQLFALPGQYLFEFVEGPKNLLTKPPTTMDVAFAPSMQSNWMNDEIVATLRLHVLHVKPQPYLHVSNTWPKSRFDEEDQLFFVDDEYETRQDWCVVRLAVQLDARMHPLCTNTETMNFMLYAYGWGTSMRGAGTRSPLQYTILPCDPRFTSQIDAIQLRVESREPHSTRLRDALMQLNIPQNTCAATGVPNTNLAVLLSTECCLRMGGPTRTNSYMGAKMNAWDAEFSFHVYHNGAVPSIPEGSKYWN